MGKSSITSTQISLSFDSLNLLFRTSTKATIQSIRGKSTEKKRAIAFCGPFCSSGNYYHCHTIFPSFLFQKNARFRAMA